MALATGSVASATEVSAQPVEAAIRSLPLGEDHSEIPAAQYPDAQRAKIAEQYGRLPISFEANRGQTDARVKYLSRSAGYTLFLTADEAVMTLREAQPAKAKAATPGKSAEPATTREAKSSVLRWRLVGADPDARAAGKQLLPRRSNYLVGNDAKQWHTGVEHYAQVHYEQVYPGIDLVYHGSQQQLEYDFIVAPGADPAVLRLRYSGQQQLSLNAQGDLVLATAVGDMVQHKPVIYQTLEGERRLVDGSFQLKPSGDSTEVGFAVAAYDHSQPLVIDPVLVYSTFLGGSADDYGYGITVDGAGGAYVTGYTASLDFPLASARQEAIGGSYDAFVARLDASGSALAYSTYLGGSGDDAGNGIAVDSAGNAYVAGYTTSTNFPLANAVQETAGGEKDAFVAKLDASGSVLMYSTYLGGSANDAGTGIAVDSAGSAFLTGYTGSINFPTANQFQGDRVKTDAFVTKLNAGGSALVYSTYLGGSEADYGYGIAVDGTGSAYVTGSTDSSDFPQVQPLQHRSGSSEVFVTKLNASGSALAYSTYLGGTSNDSAYSIAVDGAGNAYVTGLTYSSNFPLANALQKSFGGGYYDAFVTKLTASGSTLAYSTYLGGSGNDSAYSIAVDGAGNAYVTGYTESFDFPIADAIQEIVLGNDAFITKLDASGSALVYSTFLGGSGGDSGTGIAVDSAGNAYVTGQTKPSPDFPVINAFQGTTGGTSDAFISKIDGSGTSDFTPDPFSFPDKSNASLSAIVVSKILTPTGFDPPLHLSISGGSYRINGGSWGSGHAISPGDTIQLKTTAAATPSTAVTVQFTAGTVTDLWTVTTGLDAVPDPFDFIDLYGVAPSTTFTSQKLTLSGFAVPLTTTVTGGSYRINGGSWTTAAGSVVSGDTVQLKTKSSATATNPVNVSITIGTVTDLWAVTTYTDTTPDSFSFTAATNAPPSTWAKSNKVTPTGYTAAIPVTVQGGQYRITSGGVTGAWSVEQGNLLPGDTIQMRVKSASKANTTTQGTLMLSGYVAASFSVTTAP